MRLGSFTVVADGPTDRALVPILKGMIVQARGHPADGRFADLRRLRDPPRSLAARCQAACELLPCDVLFVHRDAEGAPPAGRHAEIRDAVLISPFDRYRSSPSG